MVVFLPEKVSPEDKYIKVDLAHCDRCGHGHKALSFKRFTKRPDNIEWTHFCVCPNNHEPILLKINVNKGGLDEQGI
jgi:hypothetical protein